MCASSYPRRVTEPSAPHRIRRDAVANRAGLLSAAAHTLAMDPNASVDTIARAAGLSRRALYSHFDDRDALIREMIHAGAERFNALADSVDDEGPAPLALARLALALWEGAAHVQFAAAVALDDTHVGETAALLTPVRRRVLEIVDRGRCEGTLRGDLHVTTVARLVEEAARTVITRLDTARPDASSVAVRAILGVAGLGWREADEVLRSALS